jgi:hypothetical protein
MRCKDIKYNLPDYLNNQLESELAKNISEHLLICDSCKGEMESLKYITAEIKKFKVDEPDEKYFINLLPRINTRLASSSKSNTLPFWVTKFALPFSTLSLIIIMIFTFDISEQRKNHFDDRQTIARNDSTEISHDIISIIPIPSEQILLKEEQINLIQQKATETLKETLFANNDENLYSTENVTVLVENLSEEQFSKVVDKIQSKPIIH